LLADREAIDEHTVSAARRWLAARYDAGYAGLTIPTADGGRGLTPAHQFAYELEEGDFETPPNEIWNIGHHMVVPAIVHHGTPEQRARFVVPGLRGELLFCQLFSEPDAGSDLASLATRAEPASTSTGPAWCINGQKVWTSVAHLADFGMLLARTDASTRHAGITCFILPMRADGVTVRPIRQMTGGSAFNEVFFDDVLVPDELRLGEVGAGWAITRSTLNAERVSLSLNGPHASPELLIAAARRGGKAGDPVVRQLLADVVVRKRIAELTLQRLNAALRAGRDPGPTSSMLKLQATELLTTMGSAASVVLGPKLTADVGEWGTFAWSRHVMESAGLRVGGGTDEIQRNILGEAALGLPREPRAEGR
jgi:alkylation response protein AidB-like acyl-CoA dehydrogenase